jgi:hypothetical protein
MVSNGVSINMLTDFKIGDLQSLLLLFFGGSMVLINNVCVHTLVYIKSLFYVTSLSCHLLCARVWY